MQRSKKSQIESFLKFLKLQNRNETVLKLVRKLKRKNNFHEVRNQSSSRAIHEFSCETKEERERENLEIELSSKRVGGKKRDEIKKNEKTIGTRTKYLPGSLFHPSIVAVGTTKRR